MTPKLAGVIDNRLGLAWLRVPYAERVTPHLSTQMIETGWAASVPRFNHDS